MDVTADHRPAAPASVVVHRVDAFASRYVHDRQTRIEALYEHKFVYSTILVTHFYPFESALMMTTVFYSDRPFFELLLDRFFVFQLTQIFTTCKMRASLWKCLLSNMSEMWRQTP